MLYVRHICEENERDGILSYLILDKILWNRPSIRPQMENYFYTKGLKITLVKISNSIIFRSHIVSQCGHIDKIAVNSTEVLDSKSGRIYSKRPDPAFVRGNAWSQIWTSHKMWKISKIRSISLHHNNHVFNNSASLLRNLLYLFYVLVIFLFTSSEAKAFVWFFLLGWMQDSPFDPAGCEYKPKNEERTSLLLSLQMPC